MTRAELHHYFRLQANPSWSRSKPSRISAANEAGRAGAKALPPRTQRRKGTEKLYRKGRTGHEGKEKLQREGRKGKVLIGNPACCQRWRWGDRITSADASRAKEDRRAPRAAYRNDGGMEYSGSAGWKPHLAFLVLMNIFFAALVAFAVRLLISFAVKLFFSLAALRGCCRGVTIVLPNS